MMGCAVPITCVLRLINRKAHNDMEPVLVTAETRMSFLETNHTWQQGNVNGVHSDDRVQSATGHCAGHLEVSSF